MGNKEQRLEIPQLGTPQRRGIAVHDNNSGGSSAGQAHGEPLDDGVAVKSKGIPSPYRSGAAAAQLLPSPLLPSPQDTRTVARDEFRVSLAALDESWFDQSDGFVLLRSRAARRGKRIADIFFATLLLVLLAPIMLLVALAVCLESPGPALYLQTRTGLGMRPFRMYKFRSMRQDAERNGVRWAMKNDPRVTRVGRIIRAVRLDELPQLVNVLRGEMSLIGPRPERPELDAGLAAQIPHYAARYAVLPGLSGWAQVMFPYGASVDDAREKLSYDLYYLKNYAMVLDLYIVLKTFYIVVTGKGR